MKFEWKVIIVSIVFSFMCMLTFTYACSLTQKKYYAYQVGIYKEEKNRDEKMSELKNDGFEGVYYTKDNQFYVLSLISDDYNQVKEHSSKVKGIIKEYLVSYDTTQEILLENLSKGTTHD
ncbi:MAG: hypothetical protein RR543_06145 [Erysipelotrichales bacterium]